MCGLAHVSHEDHIHIIDFIQRFDIHVTCKYYTFALSLIQLLNIAFLAYWIIHEWLHLLLPRDVGDVKA